MKYIRRLVNTAEVRCCFGPDGSKDRRDIVSTLRDIEPHARELGSERELEGVREILARGNGADRQLRVWNANRDIVEVVREISLATEAAIAKAAA